MTSVLKSVRARARQVIPLRRAVRTGRALARPLRSSATSAAALGSYPGFLREFVRYRRLASGEVVKLEDLYPCFGDRTPATSFDAHYLYQAVWAASRIVAAAPSHHLDIGSDIRFVSPLTAHCAVTFVDIRPLEIDLPRFTSVPGSITQLPIESRSQISVSCLHVAEHIGLGRYGDDIDPKGTVKACLELQRVLAPEGLLYFSAPAGRERTCFNAHRVLAASSVPSLFPELQLVEFSLVDDAGSYRVSAELSYANGLEFGCGLFVFERPSPRERA